MRRRTNQTDSLELLLDTICNMFGGVFLMAVLIVLQTQMSANSIPAQQEVSLETEKMRAEYKQLSEEVLQLESQKATLANQYTKNKSEYTDELLGSKEQFLDALAKAKNDLEDAAAQMTQIQRDLVASETAIDSIERKLQSNQQQVDDLEQQIQTTMSPKEKVRLPHQQLDTLKSPRYYVIKDDYVYPFWGEGTRSISAEPFISESCIITPESSILSRGTIAVEPREGKGIAVLDKGQVGFSFFSTLQGYSSSTHYTVFFVYANSLSFSSFQRLKQAVLDKGYLYSVSAYSPETRLLLSAGTPKVE